MKLKTQDFPASLFHYPYAKLSIVCKAVVNMRKSFLKREKGQSIVEFALVLPLILLIVCGIIDFGWLFYNQLTLNNACRDAARYAVVNATKSDLVSAVDEKAEQESRGLFKKGINTQVTFTNPTNPLEGDVVVTLTAEMNALTPVLFIISGGPTRQLVSTVVMKAES